MMQPQYYFIAIFSHFRPNVILVCAFFPYRNARARQLVDKLLLLCCRRAHFCQFNVTFSRRIIGRAMMQLEIRAHLAAHSSRVFALCVKIEMFAYYLG